jgi:hypothetical protein
MSDFYDPGTGTHVIVDGMMVERDALRIAEAVRDYDENLVVLCLDPNLATDISEEPFVIAEKGPDGILRPVLRVWQLDENVLQRIYLADNRKFNTYQTLLNMEQQQKARYRYEWEQVREETKDKVSHIAGMKSQYSVPDEKTGEIVTFFDDRPAERR